jgi:predicted transcriptional regulator
MVKFWKLEADNKTPDTLGALFKLYEIHGLNVLWANPGGITSGAVWKAVNEMLDPDSISRASIIFFLNRLVDNDIAIYEEKTGKGGYHRVYSPAMPWVKFEELIVDRFVEKLNNIFKEILVGRMSERIIPARPSQ